MKIIHIQYRTVKIQSNSKSYKNTHIQPLNISVSQHVMI